MIKKLAFVIIGIFTIFSAYAAQIVNVEYIHQLINQKWDITLNYNPELRSAKAAANMKYLLTAIDVANEILNGQPMTDYGNGEFATTQAVDTIATNTAVETLIQKPEKYVLELTHSYQKESWFGEIRDSRYLFMISARGTYYVDWGDGTEEVINKTTVGESWFGHDYATDGTYTIRMGGRATEYSTDENQSTVFLSGNPDCMADLGGGSLGDGSGQVCPLILESISGCLGCIFPTLADGSQPRFIDTFIEAWLVQQPIPENLFDGVHGAPVSNMFSGTFSFSGIKSIPENLFAGISGAPVSNMFSGTFGGLGITSIPAGLFAGISGAPAEGMFSNTFVGTKITSIPENLFAGIDTTAPLQSGSFVGTFNNCSELTGPSARINGKYLYEIWPDATSDQVNYMYYLARGLTDYLALPCVWVSDHCWGTDPT